MRSCHLQREFYFFFSNLIPFKSLSCLTAVARTSSTMVHRSGKGRHLCLDLKEKHPIFHHQVVLSCGFFADAASQVEEDSFYTSFLGAFFFLNHKRGLGFVNCFFPSIKMIGWFLSLLY